jgi:carbonic anhydrase
MHDRRSALRAAFGAAAALCPLCTVGGARAQESKWGYDSKEGPAAWAKLSREWRSCAWGHQQTPLDLKDTVRAELHLSIAYQPMPVSIVNNGHTIEVKCPPGSKAEIAGEHYDLIQYHFHRPSEHVVAGQRFDMELHLVHRNPDGHLAVIGVFIRPGTANLALQSLWSVMPPERGEEKETSVRLNPAQLLPSNSTYYRYFGSLTTPPCSEDVLWTVFKEPIEASEAQINQFAQLYPNNARPTQKVRRRFVLSSG